jgi:peptide/nickel transport system substrate-binding protein
MISRRILPPALLLWLCLGGAAAAETEYRETPALAAAVAKGALPPVAERLPQLPKQVFFRRGIRSPGRHGGDLNILMARPRDVRLMVVYGYARLVKYNRKFDIVPDIVQKVSVQQGRIFTLYLRPGHKWSDGKPFTAEDFRYYWEDIANNPMLSPTGPPQLFRVEGALARFEVLDEHTVRYSWDRPNPNFLQALARARPPFIYRPAHYLKQFHAKFADAETLKKMAKENGVRNWAALHNKVDNPYKNDNIDMPTLQPWINTTKGPSDRFVFARNPFYHKVDQNGRQLPYLDQVIMHIVDTKIIPAQAGTGQADLQARYLRFDNYTFLKKNETRSGFKVHLWRNAKGAHMALFPNLNVNDPAWRKLLRDVRFRRALSLAIHRRELNRVLYYGQAIEGQNTVLPASRLYKKEYRNAYAEFDLKHANRLLDEIGLTKRNSRDIRLLPDGRPLDIIIETAGENTEEADVLELIHDSWHEIGVKLHIKPSHRDVVRNRIYAGDTVMSLFSGLENGLPSANSSPAELAPTRQIQYQWPLWGQYKETNGKAGASPDMPEAKQLLQLYLDWTQAATLEERAAIWHKMLAIHADQVFTIGLVSGTLQPVVVNARLRNVPEEGFYNWDPGAHFGLYEPDSFWFEPEKKQN